MHKIIKADIDTSGIKRCYLDTLEGEVKVPCVHCGKALTYDFALDYLSYPENGEVGGKSVYCASCESDDTVFKYKIKGVCMTIEIFVPDTSSIIDFAKTLGLTDNVVNGEKVNDHVKLITGSGTLELDPGGMLFIHSGLGDVEAHSYSTIITSTHHLKTLVNMLHPTGCLEK